MRNETYDASTGSYLNSAVQIQLPSTHMLRMIAHNRTLRANIHRHPSWIKYNLQTKVTQISDKDTIIWASYHNLYPPGF